MNFDFDLGHRSGGFGSYLLGLNRRTYEQAGVDTPGNTPNSTKEPAIGWMTGFLFVTSFVGLLALVPLRKVTSRTKTDALEWFFLENITNGSFWSSAFSFHCQFYLM